MSLPRHEFPHADEVYQGELISRGHWATGFVEGPISWTLTTQKVTFLGQQLFILPVMKDDAPGVTLKLKAGMSFEEGQRLILRFLSSLSWVEEEGVGVRFFGGGSVVGRARRQHNLITAIREDFDFSYLPEPTDERVQLALALMRDGRFLMHSPYAFLQFFRVLELVFPNGRKRGEWMAKAVDRVSDHRAKEVAGELKAAVADVALHLRESGRCAVVHAGSGGPIINPDDPTDTRRLGGELPLMRSLAQMAIEEELGVETSMTVYRKHLYELAGFKKVLGDKLVGLLQRGEQIEPGTLVNIPAIHVELRRHDPYPPLRHLKPTYLGQDAHKLLIQYESHNDRCVFRCALDFSEERLHFDINSDFGAYDDNTAEGAEAIAEVGRFTRDYWCNGQLRIIDAETGELLSRKDAFIPVNCWVDVDACNKHIEYWRDLAEQRRKKESEPA